MKILLTGGSGDLGQILIPLLTASSHAYRIFDIRRPETGTEHFRQGSLLDVSEIEDALIGCDLVIHIAAWHGIHEARGLKTPQDFWDLNVNGTYNLLQACLNQKTTKLIHISSSSITKLSGYYGFTKRLAEEAVKHFHQQHNLQTVTLRPRAFIPYWNRAVYGDFLEWAKRFWPGAVHIDDVAQAVMLSIDLLNSDEFKDHPILNVDREPDYSHEELSNWDTDGPGTSFQKHYADYIQMAYRLEIDTSVKPISNNIQETKTVLGYQPQYGLTDLLKELSKLP
ncbi:MAG: NAD(P)-dependent oxidoreductase [Candidatus Marinimicrobia bacterium]|nr:NAD(P)-dependent oxidoreductase [Candidatus Neomarinimicrobiota bacterium]